MSLNAVLETRRKRLRELLERMGRGSAADIAERMGVHPSFVAQLKRGSKPITDQTLASIAKAARVPRTELEADVVIGDAAGSQVDAEPGPSVLLSTTPIVGDTRAGPNAYYLEYGYPAGDSEEVVETPAKNAQTYALRVRGGSMYPRMREGDVVTVDPTAEPVAGVDVIVATNDGEVMVKTLAYDRGDEIALDSLTEQRRAIQKDQIQFMHMVIGIHPPHSVQKR
jgi:repressor LexA